MSNRDRAWTAEQEAAQNAQGEAVALIIGQTRCYGDDAWYREITAGGIEFLAPLDQQDAARHYLSARHAERARVPDGWVLVPREPTEKMVMHGVAEIDYDGNDEPNNVRNAWLAMLAAAPSHPEDADGVALIAAERRRQIEVEGRTAAHDDTVSAPGSLPMAAAAYALGRPTMGEFILWPWARAWWKPGKGIAGRIRDHVKAGALLAAEIDRLQRLAAQPKAADHD